ncbi:fumarate hydratase subunit beta [Amycolatopsis mediterranei S699]|uniref:Fumarate hydratase subunit beta n=2 Tax=Amycolatopsis mediterranei TaxID=33910 RepID=A0A0H3DDH8_AMYMU|nr:fumarate hydratase C-terminal domain-containing protein [Amycolatopsis mediterranei]ADJ48995.1 fumarate hydratase subunit beta [Amycolatopsis mediterranei U32]AEK45945.1 fumarate hydratase subunit beta [Amycolatopsis mediterranei S699]AFO80703.1 fumarate hydratase subunit beta [Amycolatopsis mediterranei S699]AGT87831.1 fumarate hydratase subunit beta [Amycolatopsis mediterranei RB]KDU93887.1 fumarate hydratase [Amycolatopsis mediterranei]
MVETLNIELPADEDRVRSLRAGDLVTLTGEIVISAGLPTYRRLLSQLRHGIEPPLDLHGKALFHVGSQSEQVGDEHRLLYLNPTTSTRFDAEMPELIRGLGIRFAGGKGGLGDESVAAMRDTGCVYLSFLGGGCTLLSEAIRRVTGVFWTEMVSHYRLVQVEVERLGPLTVGIDAHGESIYRNLRERAGARLPAILEKLSRERATGRSTS